MNTLKQGETLDKERVLQALCNAVICSSVDDNEAALKLLAELLAEEGVDPNAGDEALWDNVRLVQDLRLSSASRSESNTTFIAATYGTHPCPCHFVDCATAVQYANCP